VSAISGTTSALQGLIQRDQLDLNDWVTCVSAKTPKGQEEIQKYSGEISAAKEQIARIQATQPKAANITPGSTGSSATSAATAANASATVPASQPSSDPTRTRGLSIDVWA
jgi:hypothetical protein